MGLAVLPVSIERKGKLVNPIRLGMGYSQISQHPNW